MSTMAGATETIRQWGRGWAPVCKVMAVLWLVLAAFMTVPWIVLLFEQDPDAEAFALSDGKSLDASMLANDGAVGCY